MREAFGDLLKVLGRAHGWTSLVELSEIGRGGARIRPDAVLKDESGFVRGYWEAKDERDDLDAEIAKKLAAGYPKRNIIFENGVRAVLYQHGKSAGEYDLTKPDAVADLFNAFFVYTEPEYENFNKAVAEFKELTPHLAARLKTLIETAHRDNPRFQAAFAEFMDVCKNSLNPNIARAAVDEMIIQHLLTERLMRTVFDNPEFRQRNVIAAEIEKVIAALTSQHFSREDFIGDLNHFYLAIEAAARTLHGFRERQTFINTVYERFFQGYAVKVADTHGIVYTPQPIVDFMCAAVEEVLHDEFGMGLDHPEVRLIDPATGTGNFIINLLGRIQERNPAALPQVYAERLFANEVMLLPYYVAALNIEHTYYELTGQYASFDGLCFVDTLDLAEGAQAQLAFMNEKNSERVQIQKGSRINVIIGNPPYNMGQVNENDNNKNRAYGVIDDRVRDTYVKDSKATLRNKLYDPYVKFFRWATDRLQGRDGIVCYVSNNSFVDQIAFDGMRKHLLEDFNRVYHLDLGGNSRKVTSGVKADGNVFDIRVGVGITVAVRSSRHDDHKLYYHRALQGEKRDDKLKFLTDHVERMGRHNALNTIEWRELTPDSRNTWLVADGADDFAAMLPLGSKDAKAKLGVESTIFRMYSLGVATNRDQWVYDFSRSELENKLRRMIHNYNYEVFRWSDGTSIQSIDNFVNIDPKYIKWTDRLKEAVVQQRRLAFDETHVRNSLYRPFAKQFLYFDELLNQRRYQQHRIFPTPATEMENRVIWLKVGTELPYFALMANSLVDLLPQGGSQTFPFYVYDEDGTNQRENITDWALKTFRAHYGDEMISKWDIFHYVYAVLHHPAYRETYAAHLKRDLPRIPFAPDFKAFATAGEKLAKLHIGYESVEPYKDLTPRWKAGVPADFRVKKMRLSKDKTEIVYNDVLTLTGVPEAAFAYRLGGRSALEWVIDQYQVSTDARSGITSDPNQYSNDKNYIVDLVGRVIEVSVKTVQIVAGLPALS